MISRHMTEGERSLLQICLEIAKEKFLDNVKVLEEELKNELVASSTRFLIDQFTTQALDSERLSLRILNAESVVIEEDL
jgi:hypothetical protein